MENKFNLKAPHRVSEDEFLEYLTKVCAGSHQARRQILDYYEEMKIIDEKKGKKLTVDSFGRTVLPLNGFYDYCDQAKNLFLTPSQQLLEAESMQRFAFACQGALEEEIKSLKVVRENEQKQIFAETLPPIGLADLFRYQFVNFVDEIKLDENPSSDCSPANVSTNENRLTVYGHKEKSFSYTDLGWFRLQKIWRHELTHIMSVKTDYGCNYKYLSPLIQSFQASTNYVGEDVLFTSPNNERNPKVIELFYKGAILIMEIATDFFTQTVMGDRNMGFATANVIKETAEMSPKCFNIYLKMEGIPKDLHDNTVYLLFSCVTDIIYYFSKEKHPFVKTSKYMPTHRLQEIIIKWLNEARLSSHIEEVVNERVSFLTNIPLETLRQKQYVKDKFLMVFAQASNNYEHNLAFSEYNQDTLLAQAMLLDMKHNYFKDMIKNASREYNGSLEHKQKLYKQLRQELEDARFVDDWVIKPNVRLGNAKNSTFARDCLSQSALANQTKNNLAMQEWASYLKTLTSFTHKFAPHLLEEFPMFKKEIAGKEEDLAKLARQPNQYWLEK